MDFIDHKLVAQFFREREMTESLITLQHIYLNFKVFNEGVIRNTHLHKFKEHSCTLRTLDWEKSDLRWCSWLWTAGHKLRNVYDLFQVRRQMHWILVYGVSIIWKCTLSSHTSNLFEASPPVKHTNNTADHSLCTSFSLLVRMGIKG